MKSLKKLSKFLALLAGAYLTIGVIIFLLTMLWAVHVYGTTVLRNYGTNDLILIFYWPYLFVWRE